MIEIYVMVLGIISGMGWLSLIVYYLVKEVSRGYLVILIIGKVVGKWERG